VAASLDFGGFKPHMFTAETSENEEKGIKIRSRAKVVKNFGNFSIATEFRDRDREQETGKLV